MSRKKKNKTGNKTKLLLPIAGIALLFLAFGIFWSYYKKPLFTVMKVPEFSLTDQNNTVISNETMKGKVYLVEFFFSTCPTICPVMNTNMKAIQDQINNPKFGIISISIDPKNDTSEVLLAHSKKIGANKNWHFLTGDRAVIGTIAQQFNIYVGNKEDEAQNLNHSGMIALVDENGNIRCRFNENGQPKLYYSGLNYLDKEGKESSLTGKYHPDVDLLLEDIQQLLK